MTTLYSYSSHLRSKCIRKPCIPHIACTAISNAKSRTCWTNLDAGFLLFELLVWIISARQHPDFMTCHVHAPEGPAAPCIHLNLPSRSALPSTLRLISSITAPHHCRCHLSSAHPDSVSDRQQCLQFGYGWCSCLCHRAFCTVKRPLDLHSNRSSPHNPGTLK